MAHGFSGFLRRRRRLKHFARHPLLDTLGGRGRTQAAAAEPLTHDLLPVACDDPAHAIARLKSHADGLSAREAAARLARSGPQWPAVARSGPNEVAHEKPLPWWLHLWHFYKNPFNLLLTVLAVGVRVAHRQAIERILVKQRLNSMRGSSPKFLGFGLELDLRVVTEQVRGYCRRSILLKET